MGLLDNKTHLEYYQGNNLGNYQFTSLSDIINQFMVVYVGENKVIPKANVVDVAFHAQRALQELSFDTFKSIKAYQIDLPPSLTMSLPHDYVNYTKLSWVDNAGIKHPLYSTKHTSNPFQIKQEADSGNYSFPAFVEAVTNGSFSNVTGTDPDNWIVKDVGDFQGNYQSGVGVFNGKLAWSYTTHTGNNADGWSQTSAIYQEVDASDLKFIDLSADGVVSDITFTTSGGVNGTAVGTIRLGLTTSDPALVTALNNHPDFTHSGNIDTGGYIQPGTFYPQSPMYHRSFFDIAYLEWTGTEDTTKTLESLDVTGYDKFYIVALSFIDSDVHLGNGFSLKPYGGDAPINGTITGTGNINTLDNLSIINTYASEYLSTTVGNETESSTWKNYKSITPSENNNDNYEDDTYWPLDGNRYGLEPSHAQVNGSFFIDQRLGKIHFSSNISGKTVILDYISDSLGTNAEMQVHKFAEEAMYKWIAHAILSGSSYGQALVPRLTKEKFAAIRKAKLRLSNIKLEELTQILRGKSKQIKH